MFQNCFKHLGAHARDGPKPLVFEKGFKHSDPLRAGGRKKTVTIRLHNRADVTARRHLVRRGTRCALAVCDRLMAAFMAKSSLCGVVFQNCLKHMDHGTDRGKLVRTCVWNTLVFENCLKHMGQRALH